ncbi:MAG: arginine deiminase-related protein [Pseudomonadota bacterium]
MTTRNSDGRQSAHAVVMVRPARFASNPETAATNAFQPDTPPLEPAESHRRALAEFDALVDTLRGAGVRVYIFDGTPEPHTPDAIFPNNWVSFHGNGSVVLYPMMAENRRLERRLDVIDELSDTYGFDVGNIYDLSPHENAGHFLEGTGSLVLDREHRVAYACLSARTDVKVIEQFIERVPYEPFVFEGFDAQRVPIYHTNVMMCIGTGYAVVCSAAVVDAERRRALLDRLATGGRDLIDISLPQVAAFAGNMLEVEGAGGKRYLALSARAERSLDAGQRKRLSEHVELLSSPIDTIEAISGGGVRCMLAAVHLPPADAD